MPVEAVLNTALISRLLILVDDTNEGDSSSQGFAPGTESSSYSVLGEIPALDAQLFAGLDFSSLFEINVPGFGRL